MRDKRWLWAAIFFLMMALLLLSSIRCSAEEVGTLYRGAQVSVVAANIADGVTTYRGWNVGLREANPVIGQSTQRLVAVKSATVVFQLVAMHLLRKTGHEKAAAWIGIGASTLPAFAAIHNESLTRRR